MKIGSFVSIKGGISYAAYYAKNNLNATAYMVFSDSPRYPARKPINKELARKAKEILPDIVVHAPYTINLASPDFIVMRNSMILLSEELQRTKDLQSDYLVLHPGAYTVSTRERGINQIIEILNKVLTKDSPILCLETMAGKGTEIGSTFEELKVILDGITLQDKVAICLDTCHTFDAGYNYNKGANKVLDEFDRIIGLSKIKVVHVNGSKNVCGSRKDRHAELIGKENNIRLKVFNDILLRKELKDAIFILETPYENKYKEEIEFLRELSKGD